MFLDCARVLLEGLGRKNGMPVLHMASELMLSYLLLLSLSE